MVNIPNCFPLQTALPTNASIWSSSPAWIESVSAAHSRSGAFPLRRCPDDTVELRTRASSVSGTLDVHIKPNRQMAGA